MKPKNLVFKETNSVQLFPMANDVKKPIEKLDTITRKMF